MKDEQEITIKFSEPEIPGINHMTTICEPERVGKELQLQSGTYTKAEITCTTKRFFLQRRPGSQQWLDTELYQTLYARCTGDNTTRMANASDDSDISTLRTVHEIQHNLSGDSSKVN